MAHSDFLRYSWRAGILLLGFYLSKKVSTYEVYLHNNGIVVIHEDNGDEERIYVIRNGFSLYIFEENMPYASSIIKANMDSDFAYCENPIEEIEDLLKELEL